MLVRVSATFAAVWPRLDGIERGSAQADQRLEQRSAIEDERRRIAKSQSKAAFDLYVAGAFFLERHPGSASDDLQRALLRSSARDQREIGGVFEQHAPEARRPPDILQSLITYETS
ncbi:hypothetical protein ABIA45_000388 [Bradyrhizobium sp. USDA 336]